MIKPRQYSGIQLPRAQRGVVLIVALIFLLLLTILAISASGRSLLQERMAGGLRNSQQAEMSAETALRGAEWRLWTTTTLVGGHLNCTSDAISATDGCTIFNLAGAAYSATGAVTKFVTSQGWVPNIGISYTGPNKTGYTTTSTDFVQLASNPAYIIEDLGREVPPGAGTLHESGDTGPNNTGAGQISTHIFRITARATGGNVNSVRVLQSTFDAQTNN
jgi:type IV pilus assembly protein PilX